VSAGSQYFPIPLRATGKSPEPAGWKAGATVFAILGLIGKDRASACPWRGETGFLGRVRGPDHASTRASPKLLIPFDRPFRINGWKGVTNMKTGTINPQASAKPITQSRATPRSSLCQGICRGACVLLATLILQGCATRPNAAQARRENSSRSTSLAWAMAGGQPENHPVQLPLLRWDF
jgi:hypothetical protein